MKRCVNISGFIYLINRGTQNRTVFVTLVLALPRVNSTTRSHLNVSNEHTARMLFMGAPLSMDTIKENTRKSPHLSLPSKYIRTGIDIIQRFTASLITYAIALLSLNVAGSTPESLFNTIRIQFSDFGDAIPDVASGVKILTTRLSLDCAG